MAFAFLAFAWLLGVAAAAFTDADPAALVAAASGLSALTFAVRPRAATLALVAIGAAVVLLAGWRYDATSGVDASLAQYNDGPAVTLRGVVDDEPEERATTMLYRLDVRAVSNDGRWREESGHILMTGPIAPRYEYGDLLELDGELQTPPSFPDFDYRAYLLRQGVTSLVTYPDVTVRAHDKASAFRAELIGVRSRLSDALSDVLPEPHSSLAAGILYGERASIPDDLRDDMVTTGTSHLVAVSGQNVTLVAGLVIAALAWLIGRRPAAWVSLASIVGYALLVGAQPSVVRAAIMGGVYVAAVIAGRQHSAPFALVLAAGAMTAIDPQVARDVSFQLSFAATLGLSTLAPLLRERIESAASRWPSLASFPLTRPAAESAAVTLAAIAFTLPITAVNFERVSLVAPLANLFVVPAFLAVALTSGVAAAVSLAVPGDAAFMAWLAWPPAVYMTGAIGFFAAMPLASVEIGGITVVHAIAFYALLLAGTWWLGARPVAIVEPAPQPAPSRRRALVPAAALATFVVLAGAFAWLAVTHEEPGRLTVTFLDVGQGDAILIEGPDGHRVLIDGGPGGQPVTQALARNLPFEARRIDLVVLTHPQADHVAGLLEVLDRYDVRSVLDSPLEADSALYDAWQRALDESGAAVTTADRGQVIDLGGGAVLRVLAPDADDPLLAVTDANAGSTVLRLEMGEASFLLTGDLDADGEAALIRSGTDVEATVLKVGHHGSGTSTSPAFLARVDPAIDVISVGASNPFRHPNDAVLGRLSGDVVLRTDRDGDVSISTDGVRIWVETAK